MGASRRRGVGAQSRAGAAADRRVRRRRPRRRPDPVRVGARHRRVRVSRRASTTCSATSGGNVASATSGGTRCSPRAPRRASSRSGCRPGTPPRRRSSSRRPAVAPPTSKVAARSIQAPSWPRTGGCTAPSSSDCVRGRCPRLLPRTDDVERTGWRCVGRRHRYSGTANLARCAPAASSFAMRRSRASRRLLRIVFNATRPTAPTNTIVPMTWICGGRLLRMLAQTQIGKVCSVPDVNWVMMKSSIESENASSAAGQDARQDQREGHLPERRPLVRPEVHRRLLEVAREPLHPGPDGDDHVADVEHDVGDEDRLDAEREQRAAGQRAANGSVAVPTNIVSRLAPSTISGRRHRDEHEQVRRRPAAELVARQGQRDERAQGGRDDRRDERDDEARDQRVLEAVAGRTGCPRPPARTRPTRS